MRRRRRGKRPFDEKLPPFGFSWSRQASIADRRSELSLILALFCRTFFDQTGMCEYRLEGHFDVDMVRHVMRFDLVDRVSGSTILPMGDHSRQPLILLK